MLRNPRMAGQATGLKAVVGAVVVLALIGLKVYNRVPHYRNFANEQVTLEGGTLVAYDFELLDDVKVQVTFSTTDPHQYELYVVDPANMERLKQNLAAMEGEPKPIKRRIERKGAGNLEITDLSLAEGSYYVIVDNMSEQTIQGKLELATYE